MKIRSDFVTNSSSANFTLELVVEAQDGRTAGAALWGSRESCFNAIELLPKKKGSDILAGNRSIYSAKGIDELCDLLFSAATVYGEFYDDEDYLEDADEESTFVIAGKLNCYENREELTEFIEDMGGRVTGSVSSKTDYLICNDKDSDSGNARKARDLEIPIITELEFMLHFDEDRYYEYMDEHVDDGLPAIEFAPGDAADFRNNCAEAGITCENLKTITVENKRDGTGDTAIFIRSSNDRFAEYRKKYQEAPENQKAAVLEEFIDFVKSGPELEVHDNGYTVPNRAPCIWTADENALRQTMTDFLVGGKDGWWMGQYSHKFIIDFSGKSVTEQEVIYFPYP